MSCKKIRYLPVHVGIYFVTYHIKHEETVKKYLCTVTSLNITSPSRMNLCIISKSYTV